jgi:hypothetical protein
MSNNPPAFPIHWENHHEGMTLRDYMAAKAMQGLLARIGNDKLNVHDVLAQRTYQIADAMMKAREQ